MSDRQLGYLAMAVLAAVGLSSLALAGRSLFAPVHERQALCPSVGTLKLADAVCVRGVNVAHVSRMLVHNRGVLLTLASPRPLDIRRGYALRVVDLGIMGDRYVVLDPGSQEEPPLAAGDTLQGEFVLGPSEALGMMSQLREVVQGFARVSTMLLDGDPTHPSFVQRYGQLLWQADTLSQRALTLTGNMVRTLSHSSAELRELTARAGRLSGELSREGPGMVAQLGGQLRSLHERVGELEQLVSTTRGQVSRLDSPEARALGAKLEQLQQRLADLQTGLDGVQRRGVNLRIWPF